MVMKNEKFFIKNWDLADGNEGSRIGGKRRKRRELSTPSACDIGTLSA